MMSEIISGKEAKLAWANGEIVGYMADGNVWFVDENTPLGVFDSFKKWQIKPRTISINGIEVPAPFEPKEGDDCRCYYINTSSKLGYDWYHSSHPSAGRIVWRTEEEIKQVVEASRSVFK